MATKVTLTQTVTTISVSIEGKTVEHVPRTLDDGGLVKSFLNFLTKEEISFGGSGTWGNGWFQGYFYPKDAERIREWLSEQEAIELVEQK